MKFLPFVTESEVLTFSRVPCGHYSSFVIEWVELVIGNGLTMFLP